MDKPMVDLGFPIARLNNTSLEIYTGVDSCEQGLIAPSQYIYISDARKLRDFLNEHLPKEDPTP